MNTCPLCAKNTSLHTEHLFPAWMASNENPNLKVCEACQKRFERSAKFTIEFFKERKFFKKTIEPDYDQTFFAAEHHHKSARTALLYFLAGLALKQHLILAAQNEDLLGGSFERLAQDYNGRYLEENDYQFLAIYQPEHAASLLVPQRTRIENLNAVETCILGYRFFLLTDQRPLPVESPVRMLAQEVELVIMQVEASDDLLKDFEAFMEERG